jgi:arylsulfatase
MPVVPDNLPRHILPMPDKVHAGQPIFDAKDPNAKFPPIEPLLPPRGAPNILIILLDDVGFGASSAFGGPCATPNAERLAASGLKYTRFHTTALCAPTRAALLNGRNHHSVNMAGVTEIATSAPGYTSVRPKNKAPIAEILRLNGYSTSQYGKCHEVPVWQTSPMGRSMPGRPPVASSISMASSAARRTSGTRRSTKARSRSSRKRPPRRVTISPRT